MVRQLLSVTVERCVSCTNSLCNVKLAPRGHVREAASKLDGEPQNVQVITQHEVGTRHAECRPISPSLAAEAVQRRPGEEKAAFVRYVAILLSLNWLKLNNFHREN